MLNPSRCIIIEIRSVVIRLMWYLISKPGNQGLEFGSTSLWYKQLNSYDQHLMTTHLKYNHMHIKQVAF